MDAFPNQDADEDQEDTAKYGVNVTARGERAAPTAPASTVVRHRGHGEGRLGIEERGAQAIIQRQGVEVGDVPVHERWPRLPRLVGMLQPEHMPELAFR